MEAQGGPSLSPQLSDRRLEPGRGQSLSQVTNNRTRGNGPKLCQGRFSLIRKNSFTERAVKHWKGLPTEVVELPPLEVFKRCAELLLGMWLSGGLGTSGLAVGTNNLNGLFKENDFMILIFSNPCHGSVQSRA